jgi:hypothetical protein
VTGDGAGTVNVQMVHSSQVPDNHLFKISFNSDPDSVHALSYTLTDSTADAVLFATGNVFDGTTNGQVGAGVLPIVFTPAIVSLDGTTGFAQGSPTNATLDVQYKIDALPINYRRDGFPANITIRFSDTIIDTSAASFPAYEALPVKFTVIAHTTTGDRKLPFLFFDLDGDQTLSHVEGGSHEVIQILTGPSGLAASKRITWTVQMKGDNASTINPTRGDVFEVKLIRPFSAGDVFVFRTKAEVVAADKAAQQFKGAPYVVPNPYVGAASFEPNPFGVQGRGERRMEFRNLPQGCTIRIFTVRGELVQTLYQDGSTDGYVTWNMRTKDNLDVAPGLYVYHVDGGPAGTNIGKFAIIK